MLKKKLQLKYNIILFLLFSITAFLPAKAQLFRIIYVYEEVPVFESAALKKLETYRITFQKGEAHQLYDNFATYRKLDSLYQRNVMRDIKKSLKDCPVWNAFVQKTMLPLVIHYARFKSITFTFYDIGLVRRVKDRRCIAEKCSTSVTKYSRKGKVNVDR